MRRFLISKDVATAAVVVLCFIALGFVLHSGYKAIYGPQVSDMVLLPRQPAEFTPSSGAKRVETASMPVGLRLSGTKSKSKPGAKVLWSAHRITVFDEEGNPIGTLPAGSRIEGYDEENGWIDVQLPNGQVGRIPTRELNSSPPQSDVTTATGATDREINEGGVATNLTLTISEIASDGSQIVLSNGVAYRIEPADLDILSDWQVGNHVSVRETDNGTVLVNTENDEQVRVTLAERSSFRVARGEL
ncbi:MAG: hypothetical protein ABL962_20280 [Fimbriimonadaceae bacterium]